MHKIILIVLTLLTTNSFAAELVDLYQSQRPVVNQLEQERQRVAPDILTQVLLKVVGDRSVLNAADLSPIMSDVDSLIQQTQYQRLNVITDDLTQPDKLALVLRFDELAVNKALIKMNLPLWSKSRPDVLIWLAIDNGSTRRILSADDNMIYTEILNQVSAKRGLPLLLPIMDLQDQNQIAVADLWAGFADPIEKASQRYAAKIILTARVTETDQVVKVRWQSIINGDNVQWQTKGSVTSALKSGIEELTDRLARRFTQVVMTNPELTASALEISNVRDYGDYARIIDYLSRLQYVSNIEAMAFEQDKLTLRVFIKGDKTVFNSTVAIEQVIQADSSMSHGDVMRFRLLP